MTKLYLGTQKTYLLLPIASAAALALLSLSPAIHAAEPAAPTAASSTPAPAAAQAEPTPAQMHILHQMDPALHAGMGHPHGPPHGSLQQGPHDCPHECTQSAESGPLPEHPETKRATVNGTLTIKTPEGVRTIVMSDVVHGGEPHCFWPVGGSIHMTGADNINHTATFDTQCGHVTLDGSNLSLPTKHEHGGARGPGGHHKMGKQPPSSPEAKPSAGL